MSYYDEPYDGFDTGEIDPAMMDQQYIDYLVANGAGAGLLPQVQPSGKQMTTSNITGALSANRSALFDTAFQGLGGPDAFAPGAFEPTISTTIRQEPELQQVYSYLRSPTSMEGIITQELMLGGTPATAQRVLRQLLTASPEEIAATFARYDEFFGRQPSVTVDDAESIKTNLLLELPPAFEDGLQQEVKPDGTGVNWNSTEGSVFAQAGAINELSAQIPRIGPSGPKWGTDPTTGQPVQISSGGELQWGQDESGAPVMIEITETPSEAAKTFTDLGLPTPAAEYTIDDYLSPGFQETEAQYLGAVEPAYQQVMQDWMTANETLKPTMQETMTPYKEGFAPGVPEDQQPSGERPMTPEEQAAYALAKLTYDSNPLANAAGQLQGAVTGIPAAAALGPLSGIAQQIAGGEAPNPLVAGPLSAVAGGGWRGADELAEAAMGLVGGLFGSSDPAAATQPQQANPDQAAMLAQLIAQAAQGDQSVDLNPGGLLDQGGWAGEGVNVDELMRRRAAQNAPGVPPPPGPPSDNPVAEALDLFVRGSQPGTPGALPVQPDEYAAGDAATYEQFLAENPPLGPPRTPAYARPGAQPANQPGGAGFQPGATQATVDALLAQLLPGNQQRSTNLPAYARPGAQPANQPGGPGFQAGPPGWPQNTLPSGQVQQTGPTGREDWMRAQTLTGAGGGRGSNAMPGTPYWGAGGVGNQANTDAMLAQLLPGNQPPAYARPGAQPANQPGGPAYMEGIETGERRAAQRREDEQSAQILGGTTDRTGKRVRATRTGEQARQYRYAHDRFVEAALGREQARQQTYGYEYGAAAAQAGNMRRAGVRPLDQALMARRLVLMNAGMPQGI